MVSKYLEKGSADAKGGAPRGDLWAKALTKGGGERRERQIDGERKGVQKNQ